MPSPIRAGPNRPGEVDTLQECGLSQSLYKSKKINKEQNKETTCLYCKQVNTLWALLALIL